MTIPLVTGKIFRVNIFGGKLSPNLEFHLFKYQRYFNRRACVSVCVLFYKKIRNRFRDYLTLRNFLRCVISGLSTGGTSTGEPVCLCSVCFTKKNRNRFRDFLTLRYFLQCVVSGWY